MAGGPRGDRIRPTDKKAEDAARRKREQAREIAEARREKAERKRVAHPQGGVGFEFGKDKPAAGEMDRWYQSLSKEQKEALRDPNAEVTITATASRVGSAEYNLDLSKRRGENVAKILREKFGVAAKIKVEALGEEPAEWREAPDQKDDHTDRVAHIDILPATKKADKPKEKPEKDESREKKRTTIPPEYTRDYKHSREWAENRYRIIYHKLRMGLKGRFGAPIEAARQIVDASRYRQDIEKAGNVHDKLWGVKPMRGFLFDIEKPSVQMRIKGWLREGGYDVEPMFKEYVIHWLRKGVK